MKFAEHLGAHITPEWRKQYIQYEAMKEMLYEAVEQSPSAEVTDQTIIQRFLARFDERLFQFCDKELAKINTFFYEKISEANRKYASLKAEMETYHEHAHKPSTVGLRQRRASVKTLFKDKEISGVAHTRKLHDLKLAFSEFYLSLILLQNYQTLNFTGFRKILKKHDKLMSTQRGMEWRQAHVDAAPFYTNKEVDHLITETEISNYRVWLLTVLKRIFLAPFYKVGFADFWLADQLNSLSTVLLDFEFLICFYAFEVDWLSNISPGVCTMNKYGIRAVVSCLPAWFRFAQCLRRYRDTKLAFPHLVNAGKYSTTFFSTIFSTLYKVQIELYGEEQRQNNVFFYLWISAAVISTCYTLTWDIKMDWGLLDHSAGENTFLREEIVYAYKAYYYFAMVEDFVLRFAWTLTVSIGEGGYFPGEALKTLLASLEVFRRFVWNFFRLENEHLNNCGQFRAVRDISIAPIDSNDQTQLEDMMDQEDGAYTCRSERKRLMGNKHRASISSSRRSPPMRSSKKDKGALWVFGDETMEKIPWKYKGV
ncbi:xenotropic and polytropic retrovirus receptor 1-like [Mizuhopecten yessoensis]|uniref:xenotropic and polytropic retrovirus receptor 1-like n=1 Tax=Mizuhopecten yessoensis TaxID=6573 RepID=UPI000B45A566|nr:xenotropic and polytropic retrovirus receptor 1-like [Mizuhopecten yessoensis]